MSIPTNIVLLPNLRYINDEVNFFFHNKVLCKNGKIKKYVPIKDIHLSNSISVENHTIRYEIIDEECCDGLKVKLYYPTYIHTSSITPSYNNIQQYAKAVEAYLLKFPINKEYKRNIMIPTTPSIDENDFDLDYLDD